MKKCVTGMLVLMMMVAMFGRPDAVKAQPIKSDITLEKPLQTTKHLWEEKDSGSIKILTNNDALKSSVPLHVSKQEAKKEMELLSDSQSVTSQVYNDSPETAYNIAIGTAYTDTITEENQQKWYWFESDTPGKLTAVMQTVQSDTVNYDLHLFKLNEQTMTLEEEVASLYGPNSNEQVSKIDDTGIYFLCVNAVQGFDPNASFAFLVEHSASYDKNEPDDNIWQANAYLNGINVNQTIDNVWDMDWMILQVDEEKTLELVLDNESNGSYQLEVFDFGLNSLAAFEQNTPYTVSFSAGNYLILVRTADTTYDSQIEYNLFIKESTGEASDVVITQIDSDNNVEGYIDYGYGDMWRIEHFMTVEGKILDNGGNPVPNTLVKMVIVTKLNDKVYESYGITNENGNFSIHFPEIQEAVGEYVFNNWSSYHYYDIIPLYTIVNDTVLDSNENFLYHFAYSIYRPH